MILEKARALQMRRYVMFFLIASTSIVLSPRVHAEPGHLEILDGSLEEGFVGIYEPTEDELAAYLAAINQSCHDALAGADAFLSSYMSGPTLAQQREQYEKEQEEKEKKEREELEKKAKEQAASGKNVDEGDTINAYDPVSPTKLRDLLSGKDFDTVKGDTGEDKIDSENTQDKKSGSGDVINAYDPVSPRKLKITPFENGLENTGQVDDVNNDDEPLFPQPVPVENEQPKYVYKPYIPKENSDFPLYTLSTQSQGAAAKPCTAGYPCPAAKSANNPKDRRDGPNRTGKNRLKVFTGR